LLRTCCVTLFTALSPDLLPHSASAPLGTGLQESLFATPPMQPRMMIPKPRVPLSIVTTAERSRSIIRLTNWFGDASGSMSKTATAPIEFVRMQMMVGKGGGIAQIVNTAWAKGPTAFFAGNLADVVRSPT
jgi:hypothetical protein